MELRQSATFREVARTLSFTRAAATLGYAQSSVTAQIQALEADLGAPLFDRLGRRPALTEPGRRLLPYADRLLELADEARTTARGAGEPAGSLAVGASETLCAYRLPPLLERFLARWPGARLTLRPLALAELGPALGDGSLDVAFVLAAPIAASDLVVEPLVSEPVLVLVAPAHPLAGTTRVRPADLVAAPLLLTGVDCVYRARFLRALAADGVRPASIATFDSVEAIKQCAMAGMGVAVLPAVAVRREVAERRLTVLSWDGLDLAVETQVVRHRDKWLSPTLTAFLAEARRVLRADAGEARSAVATHPALAAASLPSRHRR